MLIVTPDPRAPRAPWTCIGCGVKFEVAKPAGVAGLVRGPVCRHCSAWAAKWSLPSARPEPEPEPEPVEPEPDPEPVEAEPIPPANELAVARPAKPAAPRFTTAEDLAILFGEKTGQRMTEVAIKLERPDAEVERRLDQLCPRPRSKASLAAAMDKVRRERISGARA